MSRDVVHITSNDGWEAVYVEGELVDQGHSINWKVVIDHLGCNTYSYPVNEDWLEEAQEFPEDINEVQYGN